VLILVSTSAFAQTTASLNGTVTSEGAALPGVTVTISSPQMQGTRTTTTGDGGGYSFGSIPPGDYTVKFDLEGLASISKRVQIGVGQSGRADADLRVAAVAEAITVTAAAPSVLETPTVTTNITSKTVDELPVGRTVMRRVEEFGLEPLVIDFNIDTVLALHAEGKRALYGDAAHVSLLREAGVQKAPFMVVSLPDAATNAAPS
jgi:hypothetical protein